MLLKPTDPFEIVVEIFSGVQKVYEVSFAVPTHTKPAGMVTIDSVDEVVPVMVTCALEQVLERGT